MTFRINDQEAYQKILQYINNTVQNQKQNSKTQNQQFEFPQIFTIKLGLFAYDAPASVSNFVHLAQRPDKMSYIGKKIHQHNYTNWFQLGENDYEFGLNGYSIYGVPFSEENDLMIKSRTIVMKLDRGDQRSQFYFILKDQNYMELNYGTVFGYIIDGMQYLKIMDQAFRNQDDRYLMMQGNVQIIDIKIKQLENEYSVQLK